MNVSLKPVTIPYPYSPLFIVEGYFVYPKNGDGYIDGINEDTAFGGNKEVEKSESAQESEKMNGVNNHAVDKNQNGIENGHRKIMIGDEEDSVPNGHSHMNGNLGHLEDSDDDNVQPKAMRNQGLI